jgi:predicted metalloprotease with PDZ domain
MIRAIALAASLAAVSAAAAAPPADYVVSMPERSAHFFQVGVTYKDVRGPFQFAFPAFTPGGWSIDPSAKNVLDLEAHDGSGRALAATKIDKETWTIAKPSDGSVTVRYRIFANEKGTPYAARLNEAMAHANLACILGYAPDRLRDPARITIRPPSGWKLATSLTPASGADGTFTAPGFDVLADGIFIAGDFTELDFREGGAHYRIVFSQKPDFKDRKVVDDFRAIAREAAAVFGVTPFSEYLFLIILENETGRGGIEHLFGTSMAAPLDTFEDRETYRRFLGLTAHEFVHAWNVKRMRPQGLGPFDYTKESYTHNLYVAEGFTSYIGPIASVRGAAVTREEYFKSLGESLAGDRDNYGIRVKSLQEHSWDWWMKSDIPYLSFRTNYSRGSLVALVLDLEIRSATGGKKSLDDAMRMLYTRTANRASGYTDAELRAALVDGGAPGMDARLDAMVLAPGPLDVAAALARVGLEVVPDPDPKSPAVPFTGWRFATTGKDFPTLDWIEPGSPAAKAGLQDRDQIVAVGTRRVSADSLPKELQRAGAGKTVDVDYFRDTILQHAKLTLGENVPPKLIVRPRTDATDPQKALLEGWLAPRAPKEAK